MALKQEGGTYDVPIKIPGAVSLSLEQQGELTPFYADGIKYYVASSNGGYEGDLEMAIIPDEFREKILGEKKDTNGVLIENSNVESKEFALGFQIDGDAEHPDRIWKQKQLLILKNRIQIRLRFLARLPMTELLERKPQKKAMKKQKQSGLQKFIRKTQVLSKERENEKNIDN